jgi:Protein of unknown function (DUF1308)
MSSSGGSPDAFFPEVDTEPDTLCTQQLYASLLNLSQTLLEELTAFQLYLQSQKKDNAVDIRQFKSNVQSENRSLERIAVKTLEHEGCDKEEGEAKNKILHVLRSSNLPFHEAVWNATKNCSGVAALGKRFSVRRIAPNESSKTKSRVIHASQMKNADRLHRDKTYSAPVDIVADDGASWIKVSTITERRLLFEMAKEGWEDSDGESAEDSDVEDFAGKGRAGLDLLKLAEDMKTAASTVRVRYRHPKIHIILPKIREGRVAQIDGVIRDLRQTGASVQCGQSESRPVDFTSMLPQAHPALTSTLNIDCTILLALISDISHFRSHNLPPAPNGKFHSAIMQQIASEEARPLLETELLPVLKQRRLVCTEQAARRMREIVETMGTASEMARAHIILGESKYYGKTNLATSLQELSDHKIPANLHLPLEVVRFDADMVAVKSEIALKVAEGLSVINRSVFLYGWGSGIVTVSSNRAVAKEIERRICEMLDDMSPRRQDEVQWHDEFSPDIWLCEIARSLIGKDKCRKP